MNTSKKLLIVFGIFVVVKILLSGFVISPSIFGDEYVYAKTARGLFVGEGFSSHNLPITAYLPLYSFLLAPAYLFSDMTLIYFLMKCINAFLSSLIIFPAFFLFKEFFSSKNALFGSVLIGLMPFSFVSSFYLASENIFYPLFLFTVWCLWKCLSENKLFFGILAGICMGLTYFSRYLGLLLWIILGLFGIFFLWKKNWVKVKNLIIAGVIASLFPLLWWMRNKVVGGASVVSLVNNTLVGKFNDTSGIALFGMFLLWIFIHLSYLALSSGLIPSWFMLKGMKGDQKIKRWFFFVGTFIVTFVIVIAKRAAGLSIKEITFIPGFVGRIIGRYIDFILPLIIISGLLVLQVNKGSKDKKASYLLALCVLLGSLLFYFPLFPFNNASLTLFGLLKVGIEYLISGEIFLSFISPVTLMLVLLGIFLGIFLIYYFNKRESLNFFSVWWILALFFCLSSTVNVGAMYFNTQEWDQSEQLKLSRFLNSQADSFDKVILDEEFCGVALHRDNPEIICSVKKRRSFVGFWLNKDIVVASSDTGKVNDLIITRNSINKELISETKGGIKVYRN